ncbi:MAG TPA: helix-turn-helix domain-containing protein [Nocardioides sp.]|nr:helix-turn-helix domain-containing protein [Nocardioides sp.]
MSNDAVPDGIEPWLLAYVTEQAQPAQVDAWVARVHDAILAEMPDARTVDGVEELLRTTVREHWVAFLADFARPAQHFHLVDAAQRLSALVADLQLPLEVLIQFYRVGQQEVWAYVSELIKDLPPSDFDRADLLMYFWNRAGVWLDRSISASIEVYQAARSRVLAGAAAQRYEAVRAVLAGDLTDPREASSALGGYPISVHHTAFVLSVDDAERVGALEALAGDLVRAVGGANPLVVKPGGRQLWLWVGTRDPLDLGSLDALRAGGAHHAADVSSASGASGARAGACACVGVGTSTLGTAGFVASHREALGALRVAAPGDTTWLTRYDEVELPVLLGCSPEVDRFMARQLGPLVGDADEAMARIRETLAAFLGSGGSAEEAARALVVHRNTIRYRLGQAEELLGRPIAKISPDLSLALRHHELFHRA